ncbi:probable ATP-dependent RNA helicase DDX20 [Penaeus monodon]|uniref:probable ATP-dependent RNA helicase DDX20 n=1 Tax=Penaeus monodon TaxID=6687 RepID=UPI0018A79E44|nr:probable ATP-dependent RNA helicase DDX20 [Penaeus monodon]
MAAKKAHTISDRERTDDIHVEENVDFAGMYLSDHVLEGLKKSGFIRPSPIQLAAIPLGRCGLDLVVQAKSGTGKTCVFTVVALEMLSVAASTTQVLVIAPTREIAVQITQVINSIGSGTPGLRAYAFIGGIPLSQDKAKLSCCHIAVGTPGRLAQLVELGLLKLDNVRLFVLDEADQLLTGQFTKGVISLASALPLNKQILALSATYTDEVAKVAEELMRSPNHVRLDRDCPALLGVNQFARLLPFHHQPHRIQQTKMSELLSVLSTVTFNQCLVFTNSQLRAESICNELRATGWPVSYLTGGQAQRDRLQALDALCSYKCRILISTDLSARGLDSEHVNLVINLDMPRDQATYLHRVGRAGRFGSRGGAITLATEGDDWTAMRAIVTLANVKAYLLQEGWDSNITSKEVAGMEEVEMLGEEELNLWLEVNKQKGFPQDQKVMKSIQNGNVGERITESVGRKSNSKVELHDESEKENLKDTSVRKKNHKQNKTVVKQESKNDKPGNQGKCNVKNTKETINDSISCKKESDPEEVANKAIEKKAENQKKVSALLSKVSFSLHKFSYAEIYKELSEKGDTESASISSTITIPSLPDKLNPSESELKVLCDHIEDTNEDLENKITSIDKFWKSSEVDIKEALQALIEGKDPSSLPRNNDYKESCSDVTDHVCLLEPDEKGLSPKTALPTHEFNGITHKNTSDCADKVTESSLSERESKVNTDSGSGLYQSSKSTTQSTSELCSSKKTSNSGESKEKVLKSQEIKQKVKKSRSHHKQSQEDLEMRREPKSKKVQKKLTKRSTSTSTDTSFESSSSTDYHYQQNYNGFYDSQQQQRDYWSQMHGMYSSGYQQYAQADYSSYGGAYQNFQPPGGGEGGDQWSQQQQNYSTGYPFDWDYYTMSAYSYKRAYVESAQKFASMMDYVQSMGRMSAWIARDYHSRNSQNSYKYDKCYKKSTNKQS